MTKSFFFYDLETSGLSSSRDRIIQFAGQRTDLSFKPLGDPINYLVKLPEDILPSPLALAVNKISLKELQTKGISEIDLAKIFNEQISTPGTIFVGFNNLRFDDEFIRYLNYRNFYDAYYWHWADNRSRWDMLDVCRMTRALRPEGINWPVKEGKSTNTLIELAKANNLKHLKAHDALSDVEALIQIARLIKSKQPKLFNYLLDLRDKNKSNEIIKGNAPFIYTSGRYPDDYLKTTVVASLEVEEARSTAIVYNLRIDPKTITEASEDQLLELMRFKEDQPRTQLPIKTIKLNRCPAVAPLSVLDEESIKRLKLDMDQVNQNYLYLLDHKDELNQKLKAVISKLDQERDSRQHQAVSFADSQLYEGFVSNQDKFNLPKARLNPPNLDLKFKDQRLNNLYFIYLARNYPETLSGSQLEEWKEMVKRRLTSGGDDSQVNRFKRDLKEMSTNKSNLNLVKELRDRLKDIEFYCGKL